VKDDFGNVYTEEMEIRKYDVQRIRRSVSAALDYKINARNTIYLNSLYTWRYDRENRFAYAIKDIEPEYNDNGQITGYTGSLARQNKGGISSNRGKGRRLED